MTAPFFSIVMPAYNASATIEAAIASVLNQSCDDFELIIVDDGSNDDTLLRAIYQAGFDRRLRVVSQRNAGVSEARNLGVSIARGELLAFLDADDLWHAQKLETHLAFHTTCPGLAASFAGIAFREEKNGSLTPAKTWSSVPENPLTLTQILAENPVCTTSNLVVNAQTMQEVGLFRKGLDHAEDQEWLARLIDSGHELRGIDCILVDYRMSENGLSADLNAMLAGWRQLATHYADRIDCSAAEAIYCRYLTRRALRTGAPAGMALRFALQGMRLNAAAYLNDLRRGGLTLAGAALSPAIPRAIRPRLFA
ncbi:glycosyltransferase family 2 protein [Altericroceibacterium spongiae]|uniref:Glycosyltransferase family 2 protein n=1 Tax=Altericroceibacterium spongiae TaxID=2320269 RepID=A0A420EC85_9SPHN|nr:glycosyltransferase family A protein [Altericroceibacterium spongiae]RKF18298.1 glycosyltransferase family 2 protein [Altericroceibacterium spongiae]